MNQSTSWTKEKWKETLAALMRRAATDTAFRQKCLNDPRAAVKEVGGLDLPPQRKVRFAEPTSEYVFMLPSLVKAGGELSDAALETVAGGWTPGPPTTNEKTITYNC